MSKFLKMKETVIDGAEEAQFIKDRLYEIMFEFQNYYVVTNHNHARFEISKSFERIKYDIVVKE